MTDNGNGNGNGAHLDAPVVSLPPGMELDPLPPELAPMPPLESDERLRIPLELLDPQGVHTKPYVFPGSEGLPFRGAIPMLKEDDPPERHPQVGSQVRVDILVLSNPKDLAYYQGIWQVVANGYGQISCEERKYDENIKNWRVMVRWFLSYAYVPK